MSEVAVLELTEMLEPLRAALASSGDANAATLALALAGLMGPMPSNHAAALPKHNDDAEQVLRQRTRYVPKGVAAASNQDMLESKPKRVGILSALRTPKGSPSSARKQGSGGSGAADDDVDDLRQRTRYVPKGAAAASNQDLDALRPKRAGIISALRGTPRAAAAARRGSGESEGRPSIRESRRSNAGRSKLLKALLKLQPGQFSEPWQPKGAALQGKGGPKKGRSVMPLAAAVHAGDLEASELCLRHRAPIDTARYVRADDAMPRALLLTTTY